MWQKSGLMKGDRVRIPESLLISGNGDNFLKAEYVSETKAGILLKMFFEEGIMSEESTWSYNTFINWASVYCGNVKLKKWDGRNINAVLLNGRGPVA